MSETLYTTPILRHAAAIPNVGRLNAPDASSTRTSRLCGSRLTIDLRLKAGQITDFAQQIRACALGQAASAIVGEALVGARLGDIDAVAADFRAMIDGDAQAGERLHQRCDAWSELAILSPVAEHRSRRGSVMLPLDALLDSLGQAAGRPPNERGLSPFTR